MINHLERTKDLHENMVPNYIKQIKEFSEKISLRYEAVAELFFREMKKEPEERKFNHIYPMCQMMSLMSQRFYMTLNIYSQINLCSKVNDKGEITNLNEIFFSFNDQTIDELNENYKEFFASEIKNPNYTKEESDQIKKMVSDQGLEIEG